MLDKIKQFFFLLGIFSLIAVFYLTKKRLEINKLKDLIKKDYNKKIDNLKSEKNRLEEKVAVSNAKELKEDINELDTKKKEIKKKIASLDDDDLVSAIDSWYKSR